MNRSTLKPRTPVPRSNAAEKVYIPRKGAPDVSFTGTLLHVEKSPGKDRWTQLEIWSLSGDWSGDWVATSVGMSDRAGEVDVGDAVLIKRVVDEQDPSSLQRRTRARTDEEMQREAMAFWGWTWLAKRAADALGWSYVEEWS